MKVFRGLLLAAAALAGSSRGAEQDQIDLVNAVVADNANAVKAAIDNGANVDIPNMNDVVQNAAYDGFSLIGFCKSTAVLDELKKAATFSPNMRSVVGLGALHYWARLGRPALITNLAGLAETDVNIQANGNVYSDATPLNLALFSDSNPAASIIALRDAGALVSVTQSSNQTVLHKFFETETVAAEAAMAELLKFADVNVALQVRDIQGQTPLLMAAKLSGSNSNQAVFSDVLTKDPSVVDVADFAGSAPIHFASSPSASRVADAVAIISALSAGGANVSAVNAAGQTGLHIAASRGTLAILKELIRVGLRDTTPDSAGHFALHLVASKPILNDEECAQFAGIAEELLESGGGSLSALDGQGRTPAEVADELDGLSCVPLRNALGSTATASPTSSPTVTPRKTNASPRTAAPLVGLVGLAVSGFLAARF